MDIVDSMPVSVFSYRLSVSFCIAVVVGQEARIDKADITTSPVLKGKILRAGMKFTCVFLMGGYGQSRMYVTSNKVLQCNTNSCLTF